MPGIYTHKLCADFTAGEVSNDEIRTLVYKNYHLYTIGSNGPDFLFFNNVKPNNFWKGHDLNYLGLTMHSSKINDFYSCAIEQILKQNDILIKERMMAYLYGHITHWALDKVAHPYVIYWTGDTADGGKVAHHRLESALDAMYRSEYPNHFDEVRISTFDDDMLQAIARIYVPVAKNVYNQDILVNELRRCLNSWDDVNRYFEDEEGKKLRRLQSIERVVRQNGLVTRFLKTPERDNEFDIANRNHELWLHPYGIFETRDSFDDLLIEAKKIAVQSIERVHASIQLGESNVDDIFNNENYNTGTANEMEMKYFANMFK